MRENADLRQKRSERKQLDDLERALDELAERARDLARDALSAAGYHQHHRGEWRMRRVSRHPEGDARRADNGRFRDRPNDRLGHGQGRRREDQSSARATDSASVADEFAGPTPSPVERVLAETAATCWFAFRLHEAQYAGAITSDGMSLAQSEHAQRRIDRAHRRFLSTVKTLATLRRLALPAVQINVARQQVNQLNAGGQS